MNLFLITVSQAIRCPLITILPRLEGVSPRVVANIIIIVRSGLRSFSAILATEESARNGQISG